LDPELLLTWAKVIFSGALTAGLIPLALYFARYYWDRRRWFTFEALLRAWTYEEIDPLGLNEQDWNALVATKLIEAGFEPDKVKELHHLAVWFAQARVNQELTGKIRVTREEPRDGDSNRPE